jgi:hypothetical protein
MDLVVWLKTLNLALMEGVKLLLLIFLMLIIQLE